MQPQILILDEPAAGLDPRMKKEVMEMISQYRKENIATIILISHNMDDIARYAERVVVMQKGKIVINGSVRETFSQREKLAGMGLSVPLVTEIFDGLAGAGVPANKNIYTKAQARDELSRLFVR